MKHYLIVCCCILLVNTSSYAQRFAEEQWSATFSNYVHSDIKSMLKTEDNNFVVVGTTQSLAMKGPDIWMGKISDKPRLQWHKTFRDNNDFVVNKIVQAMDGNYVILVSVYGDQKESCRSYVFKVDQSGRLMWDKYYSTHVWEEAVDMIATTDGGFLLAGHIKSNPNSPFYYAWIAKLDNKGIMQWNNPFDIFDMASFKSIVEVKDGFVLQGNVAVQSKPDNMDAWLMKINHNGDPLWEKTYGDYNADEAYHLIPTRDGGYAFCGYTTSTGQGQKDAWLVKTDGEGELQWEQTYGSYANEYAQRIIQLKDNKFVFAGAAQNQINSNLDAWMIWTDEEGVRLGEQFYGGRGDDAAFDLLGMETDELVMVGYSTSKANNYYHEPFIANYKMRFGADFQKEEVNYENALAASPAPVSTPTPKSKPRTFSAATSAYGAATTALPPATSPMLTFKVPDLHLLTIGTNPPDLEYTEKDAIDFANAFKNQGNQLGSGNKLFNMVQAEKLTGQRASIKNIESAIEGLHRKALEGYIKPNDVLVLFISAHGFLYQNKLRIQASDYDYNSPRTTSIDYDRLLEDLDLIDCKKILFIDACHSASPNAGYAAKASVSVVNDAIRKISMTKNGLAVITSSDSEEQSYEDRNAKNGFFTKALLQGLKGEADYNKNNIVNLEELFTFVQQRVPAMVGIHTKQRQNPKMVRNDLGDLPIYVVK
ncbi:MAG: caspase domain-containing protein [Chitinophagales bacterium]